jgi:voltage-dependent calcium channel L type alpha-1D
MKDGGGAVSALRAFRLFRIVKLARSWESLKILLDSIAHTIAAIGNFTILLVLFIYVYSLLGMQFFAGELRFNKDGEYDPDG